MKKFFLGALIIGIFLGPGYKLFYEKYNCKMYGKHEVFSQKVSTDKRDGETFYTKSNSKWNSPIYIDLKPSMNPICFVTETQYYLPIEYTTHKSGFVGRLSKDNSTIWQEEFSVVAERKNTDSQKGIAISMKNSGKSVGYTNLKTFNVEKSGKYKLLMLENYHSDLAISKINIIVKGNLKTPDKSIIKAGYFTMGTSLLLLLLSLVISKKSY